MPFINADSLKYLIFESFSEQGITHGVFTRNGGISPTPWNTLNVGATVGDDQDRVRDNRTSIFRALGLDPSSSFDVWQIHSKRVVRAACPRDPVKKIHKADAIITNVPGVSLFMRFADCVPILFYDPIQKAVGIAHAGWKGTLENIAKETIQAMKNNFNSQPADLITAIGPSISGHHYEIGPDVEKLVHDCYGKEVEKFLVGTKNQVKYQKISHCGNYWE